MFFKKILLIFFSCLAMSLACAAPISFLSSADLLKDKRFAFSKASEADLERVIKRLPSGFSVSDYLRDKEIAWYRHAGDLVIDRSLDNKHALIVEGDLVIKGSYDDYRGDVGMLVVLGNMQVEHVVNWGSLAVGGRLQAQGLVYANYNDFTFDAREVTARALFVSDKSGHVGKVDAPIYFSSEVAAGKARVSNALQTLVPEIVLPGVEGKDADGFENGFFPDFHGVQARIAAGDALFRAQPGPNTLMADLKMALGVRLTGQQFDALVGKDRLLMAALAQRADLKPAWQLKLVAGKDAFVLNTLAHNKAASTATLEQIASISGELAGLVMEHAKAPKTLVAKLLKTGGLDVRRAAAARADLSAELVLALSNDHEAAVRAQLVEVHGQRLAVGDLARLCRDPDSSVRKALVENGAIRLDANQVVGLSKDAVREVRYAIADRLAQQTMWQQLPTLTPNQLETLALGLADDPDEQVRLQAAIALTPAEQERRWKGLSGKARERFAASIARSTRSEMIQVQLARGDSKIELEGLLRNPFLVSAVQTGLFRRLPPAKDRDETAVYDMKTAVKAIQGPEGIVADLLENPNVVAEVLEQAAKYCAETNAGPLFCSSLTHRKDLSPKVIDLLRKGYRGEAREDLALTITLQPQASREQLEWAIPIWMDDDAALLKEFKTIQRRDNESFWEALAGARSKGLRELSARNVHTPALVLVRLLKDSVEDVAGAASANPALPAHVLETMSFSDLKMSVWNPSLNKARLEALLQWADAKGDRSLSASCLEQLALRMLRRSGAP